MTEWEERIETDPRYAELKRLRRQLDWGLTVIICLVYLAFMLAMGYAPDWLGKPFIQGEITSIGLPIGAAVIIFSFIVTGFYTWWANRRFDTLIHALEREVRP